MNIYEFTQALRRQWKLLLIGILSLITGVLAATFEISRADGSFQFESRITPKYESSVEMVVVPAGLESLASRQVADGSKEAAGVYAQMLGTTEAARQIEEAQGVELIDTLEAISEDSSFIEVTATSPTAEGAVRGALGAFRWLEGRLAEQPKVAQVPETDQVTIPGEFVGDLLVDVDARYALADEALTLVVGNSRGEETAISLQGAAGDMESQTTLLAPDGALRLSVEREPGISLDEATVQVPPLPDPEAAPPPLVLAVEWGGVDFDEVPEVDEEAAPVATTPEEAPGARLDVDRLGLRWDTEIVIPEAEDQVSLLLITEEAVALETDQRRTPLMVMALLGVGAIALLVLATTVDTWQQARLEQRFSREQEATVSLESRRQGLHIAPSALEVPDGADDSDGRGRRSSSS